MTLDFVLARAKHLDWKIELTSFLEGRHTLTKAQAISHKDCELGKWLYAEGLKKYGYLPSMQELEQTHVELHAIVRKVLQMKHAGNEAGAEQEFSRLRPVSDRIIKLLKDVEKSYEASAKGARSVNFCVSGSTLHASDESA
jgi:methyl-accepting chemotaxis protein